MNRKILYYMIFYVAFLKKLFLFYPYALKLTGTASRQKELYRYMYYLPEIVILRSHTVILHISYEIKATAQMLL